MNKLITIFTLGCLLLTSCSDDDTPANGGDSTGLKAVPSSVVCGLRIAGITGPNGEDYFANYNSNGTINYFVINSLHYNFEYDNNSSTPILKRIYAENKDGDEFISWEATNFNANSNGFVVSYTESVKYYDEYESGSANLNMSFTYNSEGQVSNITQTGTQSYTDEDGTFSGDRNYIIEYNYIDGNLISSKGNYGDSLSEVVYEYDDEEEKENTYNIFTPQMAAGIGQWDPVAYMLAYLGYVGNASKMLPIAMTETEIEVDNYNSWTYGISYVFDSQNKIEEVKMTNEYGTEAVYYVDYFEVE